MVAFPISHFFILYIIFPFNFIHTFLSFFSFFFFSLVFSPPHTYTHSSSLLFLFLLDSRSLSLSLQLSLFLLFLFLLDSRTISSSLCDKKQRKNKQEACSTVDRRTQAGIESAFTVPSRAFRSAAAYLPPQRSPDGLDGFCLFFSFLFLLLLL